MRSLIVLALVLVTAMLTAQKDKRTPFKKVIYKNGSPFVVDKNDTLEIISIEDVAIKDYLSVGAMIAPNNWQKGFHRYIHYTWDELNVERGDSVKVEIANNGVHAIKFYALEIENRDLATEFHDSIITTYSINRPHIGSQFDEFKYLTSRIDTKEAAETWMSPPQVLQDLAYLEWELVNHYSYLNYRGFDYEGALDAIRSNIQDGISKRDFARQLLMFIANFGDGHTRLSRSEIILEKRRLPFNITQKDGRFYGPREILKIEGIPIEELYKLALNFVPKTTIGFQTYVATRLLNYIEFFLKEAGTVVGDQIEVEFTNGRKSYELIAPPRYQADDLLKDSIYEGNIGYLAIREKMEDEEAFLNDLDSIMMKMLTTDALVIDIRGNGGGSRAPLLSILPYLISKPVIANAGMFRIDEQEDHHPALGYLESRFMYPLSIDTNFLEYAEYKIDLEKFKQTVEEFNRTFRPEQTPDSTKFSEMHYLYVEPNEKYYDKKVIVLINEQCFSASDIFAAGIRLGNNVQLMGKTTGGGSGFSMTKTLPNSKLRLRHSRMFSYQPNGKMYDGQGVVPDIFFKDENGIVSKALELLRDFDGE